MKKQDPVLLAYLECALWLATDDDGTPLDRTYSVGDFHPDSVRQASEQCAAFVASAGADLDGIDPAQVGHDFYLTRNRHGVGFWDRDLGTVGQRLADLAHPFGESDVYVGDDGQLHLS